jgi:hypothetical protein
MCLPKRPACKKGRVYARLLKLGLTEASLSPPPSRGAYTAISIGRTLKVALGAKEGRMLKKK